MLTAFALTGETQYRDWVLEYLDAWVERTEQNGGIIPSIKDRLNQQVASMDDQIAKMQARLALQRQSLQQEFTQADAAMSQLKNQSSSLSNIGSGLGSF